MLSCLTNENEGVGPPLLLKGVVASVGEVTSVFMVRPLATIGAGGYIKDSGPEGKMEFSWSDEVELEWEFKPFLVTIPLLWELVSEWLGLIINGDIILGNILAEE